MRKLKNTTDVIFYTDQGDRPIFCISKDELSFLLMLNQTTYHHTVNTEGNGYSSCFVTCPRPTGAETILVTNR